MQIGELMTQPVASCRANDNLERVVERMTRHECGSIPVVDVGGRVRGIITDRDVCMAAHKFRVPLNAIAASEAMSAWPRLCTPHDTIDTVQEQMSQGGVRRMPVVDDAGRLAGIVSVTDLARAMLGGRLSRPPELSSMEATRRRSSPSDDNYHMLLQTVARASDRPPTIETAEAIYADVEAAE